MPLDDAIAPLREELEVIVQPGGVAEIKDPLLMQIITLRVDDLMIARQFDGRRGPQEVSAQLQTQEGSVFAPAERVRDVARRLLALHLLHVPEAYSQPVDLGSIRPPGQMDAVDDLPPLPVVQPEARWACHACGECCHGLQVELSAQEEARIQPELYRDVLGDEGFAVSSFLSADGGSRRVLRQRADGRCVFLAEDGRCHVHGRQGMDAKPQACQMFPLMVVAVPDQAPRLGLRVSCRSMHLSQPAGPLLSERVAEAHHLANQAPIHSAPDQVVWFGERIPFAEYDAICDRIGAQLAGGLSPSAIRAVDRAHLHRKVFRSRRRYGRTLLDYIHDETHGEVVVGTGAYADILLRAAGGYAALQAMAAGAAPPVVPADVARFLTAQVGHVTYLCGPLYAPDAGHGMVALLLAAEATMHAVGEGGTLAAANAAFEALTNPITETFEHMWPVLRAIDPRQAALLAKEIS